MNRARKRWHPARAAVLATALAAVLALAPGVASPGAGAWEHGPVCGKGGPKGTEGSGG